MRTDVYQKITDRIVSELERGVSPASSRSRSSATAKSAMVQRTKQALDSCDVKFLAQGNFPRPRGISGQYEMVRESGVLSLSKS